MTAKARMRSRARSRRLQPSVVKNLTFDGYEPFDRVVYPFAFPM